MATYTGNFLLVRTHLVWEILGNEALDEDVRVCTFHNINLEGGAPSSSWPPGDLTLLATRFKSFWNASIGSYTTTTSLKEIRMYLAGPISPPPQPPIYEENVNVVGLSSADGMPPQVAISYTEKAGQKKGWGRFYMPAPAHATSGSTSIFTSGGRIQTAVVDGFCSTAKAMYTQAKADTTPFVIYHPYLPVRVTKGGTTLPERPAEAVEVESIQVDDVVDTIRSRRWEIVKHRSVQTV